MIKEKCLVGTTNMITMPNGKLYTVIYGTVSFTTATGESLVKIEGDKCTCLIPLRNVNQIVEAKDVFITDEIYKL